MLYKSKLKLYKFKVIKIKQEHECSITKIDIYSTIKYYSYLT